MPGRAIAFQVLGPIRRSCEGRNLESGADPFQLSSKIRCGKAVPYAIALLCLAATLHASTQRRYTITTARPIAEETG